MDHTFSVVVEKLESNISLDDVTPIIKAHRIRWLVLFIYVLYSAISNFQWVQYSAISNVVVKFYHVSASEVDWTATVFMIVWPILVLPASFIVEKQGLRVAALVACLATATGGVIKVFSIDPDLFYVVMIGQSIASLSQVFILSVPTKIAATWFPSNEVSMACSIGVFGMQLGRALGYLTPTNIVKYHATIGDIAANLYTLCSGVATAALLVVFIVFLYYPKKPSHAPSQAQLEERVDKQVVTVSLFLRSLKTLARNRSFLIHTLSYGICLAIFSATGTLLKIINHNYLQDADEDARRMGLILVVVGMFGPLFIGFVLDTTHKYKETTFVIYLLCALSMGGLLFALEFKLEWMIYAAVGIFSFLANAYMVAGIEFAMEITFPSPECTTTGILIATSQLFGIVFTIFLTVLNSKFETVWVLVIQVFMLLIGTLLTYWTPNNLTRQEVFRTNILFEKVSSAE